MAQSPALTTLAAELVSRVAAGVTVAITGKSPDWFGPADPPAPVAQQTEGRAFDYPVAANLRMTPRSGELVGFAQMRALADGYDLMRLIIETRKDQMCALSWTIKPRDVAGTVGDESAEDDPRCEAMVQFLRFPDRENDWETWLRMVLEDLLVIDAPTLYLRRTLGGALYALEPMDGATVKRLIDESGRTPTKGPAYQQILKGVPAADYTREQLLYLPRNRRTHKVYGYSPVEQVITTVNLALRRQLYQMNYYDKGSAPDLIFAVPETWQPEQIRKFQDWWDVLLEGNGRSGTKFVPHGVAPINTRDKALKDEFDEWLARIICFAFSVSPQPFVREMNRATAQTGQETALSEGLAPLKQWVKGLIDRVLAQFGCADLEFIWQTTQSVAPEKQAEIDATYVNAGILTADEVRAKRFGMGPKPKDAAPTATQQPDGGTDKVTKGGKPLGTIKRDRPLMVTTTAALQAELAEFLRLEAPLLAADVVTVKLEILGKAGGTDVPGLVSRMLNKLTFGRWQKLADLFGSKLATVATDGTAQALLQIGMEDATGDMLSLVNQQAVAYAQERAAELVGMRIEDGELVPNPNPLYAITESTRDMLRGQVTQAIEQGWSNDRLANEITQSPAFGAERAELIARTETAMADIEGNQIAYEASGQVEGKEWLTAPGCCPKCSRLNGKIVPLEGLFVAGAWRKNPPLHPRCRCDMLPVLQGEMPENVDMHNAQTHLRNVSNEMLDDHSQGLPRDKLSLGDKSWGGTPVEQMRRSKELFDELIAQGIEPPDTWAVHAWSIDSRYVSEQMRGTTNPYVNPVLRAEFAGVTEQVVMRLNRLFDDPRSKLSQPVVVFRGEGLDQGDINVVQQELDAGRVAVLKTDYSYQSTTLHAPLAEDFANRSKSRGKQPVLHVALLGHNVGAIDITRYHYYHPENEILLAPNLFRKVINMYQRDDGTVVMESIIEAAPDPVKKVDDMQESTSGRLCQAFYEDPREDAMMGYSMRIVSGPPLDSIKPPIPFPKF